MKCETLRIPNGGGIQKVSSAHVSSYKGMPYSCKKFLFIPVISLIKLYKNHLVQKMTGNKQSFSKTLKIFYLKNFYLKNKEIKKIVKFCKFCKLWKV